MTQVLAAMNVRLSEEYGKIDIPNQDAKSRWVFVNRRLTLLIHCVFVPFIGRLLADAKYLHQKLSGLKHVGTLTSMLETVIAERRIPPGESTQVTSPRLDQAPQSAQKLLSRSATITASANQRLRGLLSGRSPTFDKMVMGPPRKETPPLPHVPRTSSPVPSASTSVTSLLSVSGTHGLSSASASTITLVEGGGGASGVGLPLARAESPESRTSGAEGSDHAGFRRIESQGNDEVVSEMTELERNLPCEEDGVTDGDVASKTASKLPE